MRNYAKSFLSVAALAACSLTLPAQEKGIDTAGLKKEMNRAVQSRDWPGAQAAAQRVVDADAKDGEAWFHLGYALHALKKYDEALSAHKQAADLCGPRLKPVAIYNVSCVYAIQKKPDDAFAALDRAVAAGFAGIQALKTDEDLVSLRQDARFEEIVAAVEKAAANVPMTAFAYTTQRRNARVAYFGQTAGAQVAIDYGAVPWREKFASVIQDKRFHGKPWRFGANAWTNLDTNVPVTIAGKRFAAGLYYLTLTAKDAETFVMTLHDPIEVRKSRIDPFQSAALRGGTEVELTHATTKDEAGKLEVELKAGKEDNTDVKLTVSFGPHRLTAPVKVHVRG